MIHTVIVLAKVPLPGRAKSRLCPPLTFRQAAMVARAALDDTLEVVARVHCDQRVFAVDQIVDWLRPPGFRIVEQAPGGLGDRLAAVFANTGGPTVLIGMDTPQLTPTLIELALATLRGPDDAVLGPALDGGFWLIGMTKPRPGVFERVPMSTDDAFDIQWDQLRKSGCRVHTLPVLRDVDRFDDLAPVAALAPHTRFAAVAAALAAPSGRTALRS